MENLSSTHGFCPVTNVKCNWSYKGSLENPSFVITYSSKNPSTPEWKHVGTASTGGEMYAREGTIGEIHPHFQSISQYFQTQEKSISLPEPNVLHKTYSALLQACPLQAKDYAELDKRGFSDNKSLFEKITLGSLSIPANRPALAQQILKETKLSIDELLSVPGFFLNKNNHLSVAGPVGILLPTYDTKGRIVALQVRQNEAKLGSSKYVWMSSKNHKGLSPGAPACFLGNRHAKIVWVTEGVFKALAILLQGFADAVISIAGVGNTNAAMERIHELTQAEKVVLCYDADYIKNKFVLQGLAKTANAIKEMGLQVEAVGWEPIKGKGIDDALCSGLKKTELHNIPLDGVQRAAKPVKGSQHFDTEALPTWKPEEKKPSEEALRQKTFNAIVEAFKQSHGTFHSIAAPTNTGKTYVVTRHAPKSTLLLYRNYKLLEEAEDEFRSVHGPGMVRVLYGRQKPPTSPEDSQQKKRYERAGCPEYAEMIKRAERGHSACKDCPLAWKPGKQESELCPYWRQRLETANNPTPYLLSVPQAVTTNSNILDRLACADGKQQELFFTYTHAVIDDIPDFDGFLCREQRITQDDIQQWQEHPLLHRKPEEHQTLIQWLTELQKLFSTEQENPNYKELFPLLQTLSQNVAQIKEPVCEFYANTGEKIPLRAVNSLASWLARGEPIRIHTLPTHTKSLSFLNPATELIQRLRCMTILNLDATPDESQLRWLSKLLGMEFYAPEMPRCTPPIFQIPDLLWDKTQVEQQGEFVTALVNHVQKQKGIALGFKQEEETTSPYHIDGHWGRDERGLNAYKGAKSIVLIGHYAIPLADIENIAWRRRTFARVMHAPTPDELLQNRSFDSKRTYGDPWRPWTRTMYTSKDPLVEHIRRHQYTSHVVQGGSRTRDWNAPIYLLSGEPLDGLPWEIPVELITRVELQERLQLKIEKKVSAKRQMNSILEKRNTQRTEEFRHRVDAFLSKARSFSVGIGRLPGVRELQRFLSEGKKSVSYSLIRTTLQKLEEEKPWIPTEPSKELLSEKENFYPIENTIERGVSDCSDNRHVNEQSETPSSTFLPSNVFHRPKGPAKTSTPSIYPPKMGHLLDWRNLDSKFASAGCSKRVEECIPLLARVRLSSLYESSSSEIWHEFIIKHVADGYQIDPLLLCASLKIKPPRVFLE